MTETKPAIQPCIKTNGKPPFVICRSIILSVLTGSFLFFVPPGFARPDLNIELLSNTPISGTKGCWGYVDSATNKEYALICATNRLEIWDVSDPYSPTRTSTVPTTGRDLKQVRPYSHYALAVNQSDSGLQIIDLSKPDSAVTVFSYRTNSSVGGAHTVHIDGHYAYLGMNGNAPYSWRVIDISDPLNPLEVGRYLTPLPSENYWQSHDSYVKEDTAYIAFLSSGFSIVDISNKSSPKKIADVLYPGAFTHNCWPTENGRYLFTTDEVAGGHLRVWDIHDPASPIQVAEWMPPGIPSIIHNVQVKGNYLYISYYADGVVILDIEDPAQPIEVGHYDTAPQVGPTSSFAGCWDFFPYFPSGKLVASNYSGPAGMWLLRFNGAKAGQIRGVVTNFLTDETLSNVSVRVLNTLRQSRTDSAGNFSVRTDSGMFLLEFSLADFLPETLTVAGQLNDTIDIGIVELKPTFLLPATPADFAVLPENGGNIVLSWRRPPDTNLIGFRIYRTALNDTVNFFPLDSVGPAESTYVDSGTNPGERFFYRIASVNSSGFVSPISPVIKAMRFKFGDKLLLVDRTAYCEPYIKMPSLARDSFYNFHARLMHRFEFDTLQLNDCTTRFQVDPAFVSRHPCIILHSSEFFTPLAYDNASFLSFFTDYIKAGGKLIIESQWCPVQPAPPTLCDFNSALLPNADAALWDTVRSVFGFECLNYPLVHILDNNIAYQSFMYARSMHSSYPNLQVDSTRVDYFVPNGDFVNYPYPTLPNVGYLTNRNPSEELYTFGSILGKSDAKDSQTVAKKHLDPSTGGGFVWFSFPLYFMKEDSAKKAFRQALADLGVVEDFPKGDFNRDGVVNVNDFPYLSNWIFLKIRFPYFDADDTDMNCDGRSSPADLSLLLLNSFTGQPLPCN